MTDLYSLQTVLTCHNCGGPIDGPYVVRHLRKTAFCGDKCRTMDDRWHPGFVAESSSPAAPSADAAAILLADGVRAAEAAAADWRRGQSAAALVLSPKMTAAAPKPRVRKAAAGSAPSPAPAAPVEPQEHLSPFNAALLLLLERAALDGSDVPDGISAAHLAEELVLYGRAKNRATAFRLLEQSVGLRISQRPAHIRAGRYQLHSERRAALLRGR